MFAQFYTFPIVSVLHSKNQLLSLLEKNIKIYRRNFVLGINRLRDWEHTTTSQIENGFSTHPLQNYGIVNFVLSAIPPNFDFLLKIVIF